MHDNQLLSVQSFKRRVGPWSGNGQPIVRPWSHRESVSDTGFRWAIALTSSTAQGPLLRESARNLQGTVSRVCCQLYGWYNTRAFTLMGCLLCVRWEARMDIVYLSVDVPDAGSLSVIKG